MWNRYKKTKKKFLYTSRRVYSHQNSISYFLIELRTCFFFFIFWIFFLLFYFGREGTICFISRLRYFFFFKFMFGHAAQVNNNPNNCRFLYSINCFFFFFLQRKDLSSFSLYLHSFERIKSNEDIKNVKPWQGFFFSFFFACFARIFPMRK